MLRPYNKNFTEVCGGTQPLRGADSGLEASVGNRVGGPAAPGGETLFDEAGNRTAILINQFQPRQRTHLGEINSTETHAGDENVYPIANGLSLSESTACASGLRAVRLSPARFHFGRGLPRWSSSAACEPSQTG